LSPASLRDLITTTVNLKLRLRYLHTSFKVKLAFFTVFVLTIQTGFATRQCFCFSSNDSSIEQVCPPLVCTMCKEVRTVTRGAQREKPPWKIFVSPGKTCWKKLKTVGHTSKFFGPLSENSSHLLMSQAGYVPERRTSEKEPLLPKRRIFGTSAPCKQGHIQCGLSPTLKSKEVTLFTTVLYNLENNISKPIPNKTLVMFELSYCSRYNAILSSIVL